MSNWAAFFLGFASAVVFLFAIPVVCWLIMPDDPEDPEWEYDEGDDDGPLS